MNEEKFISRLEAERLLQAEYPEAKEALIAAAVAPVVMYRSYPGGRQLRFDALPFCRTYIERELSALDWVRNNPHTTIQFLKDQGFLA